MMAMEFFKKIETRIAMHCNGLLDQVQYRTLLVKMVKVNSYSESPPLAAVHGN